MSVELMIELGHKAWKNAKPTEEGHTHDWIIFIQGVNGNEIKHFVERVIFHLPDSYPDPKRSKERPPFFLSGSTSQSFSLQIDVFFCTKEKFNKVTYIYDLQVSDQVVNTLWEEKLTFKNPCKDFMEKLLLGGGNVVDVPKTFEMNRTLLKCKVEPVEETENIQANTNDETVDTTVEKNHGLHKLLKENENLKNANEEIKEKITAQEKLIVFYGETLSSYETSILTTNMGINQLKQKIQVDEKEILFLKPQLEALQNELLLYKNSSVLNPNEMQRRKGSQKRKNADMSMCVAEHNRVFQHINSVSSLHKENSNTSETSRLFKKQNICRTFPVQRNPTMMHNQQNELLSCENSSPVIFDRKKTKIERRKRNRLKRKQNGYLNLSVDMKNALQSTESLLSSSRDMTNLKISSMLPNQQNELSLRTNSPSNGPREERRNGPKSIRMRKDVDMNLYPFFFKTYIACDDEKYVEGSSIKDNHLHIGMCTEPHNKDFVEKPVDFPLHEQQALSSKGIKYSSTNCEENDKEPSDFDLKMFKNAFQNENLLCQEFHQGINDATAPKLITFINKHYPKLEAINNRIKNAKILLFNKKMFFNPISSLLQFMNSDHYVPEKHFRKHLQKLIKLLTDPKKSFDMTTLIFLVVDYFGRCNISHTALPTRVENRDTCVTLLLTESCIISALYEIKKMSMPQYSGLVRNTLKVIHQMIISKKNLPAAGLSSLCRVFMEICKLNNERCEPLFLCCELLRLDHPFAPYLINSLAAVWRAPFYMCNDISVDEKMLLGSITYAINIKPKLMNCKFWNLTCKMTSEYFQFPIVVDPHEAVQFLTYEITSRCVKGSFNNLWMLTLPLTIFVSKETFDWKMNFKQGYILPNLLHFSTSANERAFNVFCNLYVDIFSFHPGTPDDLMQYFSDTEFYKDKAFVRDWAAVALLKYVGYTDKPIPAALRDWFLSNQDKPSVEVILDLYCKKVMESHDKLVLLDDVIIL